MALRYEVIGLEELRRRLNQELTNEGDYITVDIDPIDHAKRIEQDLQVFVEFSVTTA